MIVIDGQQTDLRVENYGNLEELLLDVMDGDQLENRVVTDVLVNKEIFSEIYPHQAEDIDSSEIQSVEIVSMPVAEMAMNISQELSKVVELLTHGGREVADLFRQADDAEALELYQDLLEVSRNFIAMVSTLLDNFHLDENPEFVEASEELSDLFSEMMDVMENEDWILLSDLLEYEFLPTMDKWKIVIHDIQDQLTVQQA